MELPVPRGIYHGLYIELKAGKNKTTDNQGRWLCELSEQGYKTAVCYGWAEAAEMLKAYLRLPRVDIDAMLRECVSADTYARCVMGDKRDDETK